MKRIITFILILCSLASFSQSIINRALPQNTVSDARLQARLNLFLPAYLDTTAANLSKGIDSCGAKIFTYTNNTEWLRACNPKRWIRTGGSGGSIVTDNTNTVTLSGSGDALDPLIADVNLSTSAPNAIIALPDGLYVPNVIRNGLVYGGAVTWISGYSYHVTAAGYFINNVFYTSPETTVTLSPADPDSSRIDVFAVNSSSAVEVLEGVPASNPQEPSIDVTTQLRLSIALVEAGTTEPSNNGTGLRRECIYQENTEWTAASSTVRINPNSTNNPCVGLKDIEGTNVINGDNIVLTRPSGAITISDSFQVLTFQIRSKANWGNQNRRLQFQWFLSGTAVGGVVILTGSSYGFSSNLLTCQTVSIPLTDFGLPVGASINQLRIRAALNNGSIGWYIDNICLQNQLQTVFATPLTLQNGLVLDNTTNIGELGLNPLLHNTTITTDFFSLSVIGNPIYEYPLKVKQTQSFQYSSSIASFDSYGGFYATNLVKLGVNYTGSISLLPPDAPDTIDGNFGRSVGYFLGVNARGIGSLGFSIDDTTSKTAGIFFHTQDTTTTDAITIYGLPNHPQATDYPDPGDDNGLLYNHRIATFKNDSTLQFFGYPSARNDGTTTKAFYADADGNVLYGDISAGISGITADNGLTANTATNVQLGGTLLGNTIITTGAFNLTIQTSTSSVVPLVVTATDGIGISTAATSGTGLDAYSASGLGLKAHSDGGSYGATIQGYANSSNISVPILSIQSLFGGSAAGTNFGGQIDFNLQTSNFATIRNSNSLKSIWTTATDGSRTSQFIITGINNAVTADLFTLSGTGALKLNKYTTSAFTGTPTNSLFTDASGNVIQGALSVNALDVIGSSPNANGATITGSVLNLQPASSSFGGVVTTGTQSFEGYKTFLKGITISDNSGSSHDIYIDGTVNSTQIGLYGTTAPTAGTPTAYSLQMNTTFTASANNQRFYGIDFVGSPNFGAFTGVDFIGIRTNAITVIPVTSSAAGTLTLDATASCYVFSGTTTTWTLPAISTRTGWVYNIKNRGSGAITLNAAGGANEIYSTSAVSTITINAGTAIVLIGDGIYWTVQ